MAPPNLKMASLGRSTGTLQLAKVRDFRPWRACLGLSQRDVWRLFVDRPPFSPSHTHRLLKIGPSSLVGAGSYYSPKISRLGRGEGPILMRSPLRSQKKGWNEFNRLGFFALFNRAQRTWCSSTGHASFAKLSRVFSPYKRVKLVISAFPLAWRWPIEVKYFMHRSLQNSANLKPLNYRPLSVIMILGRPKWQTMNFHMKSARQDSRYRYRNPYRY